MKRDMAKIVKALNRQGWTIGPTKSGHYKAVSPSGDVYFMASTPSDRRTVLNARAGLRRLGAVL